MRGVEVLQVGGMGSGVSDVGTLELPDCGAGCGNVVRHFVRREK